MSRNYFNVFFPENTVNVGQRFFFFNSLKYTSPKLKEQVDNILEQGQNSIFKSNDSQKEGALIIKQALDFLKNTIDFERKQEIDYFKGKIINNPNIPKELSERFSGCYKITPSEGLKINYIEFINTINEFYLGTEEYKDNLNYELERLTQLDKIIEEFNNLSKRKKEIYRKAAREQARKNAKREGKANADFIDGEFLHESFKSFLLDKFKKYGKGPHKGEYVDVIGKENAEWSLNTQTRANKIQTYLADTFSEIWDNQTLLDHIIKTIREEDKTLTGVKKETIAFLISNFCITSAKEIIRIIEEEENVEKEKQVLPIKQAIKKRLAEEFASSIGFTDNNTDTNIITENQVIQAQMKNLINRATAIEKDLNQSENIKKRMFRGIDPDKIIGHMKGDEGYETRGGIEGLSQNVLEALKMQLQEEMGTKYETAKTKNNSGTNKKSLREEVIDNLIKSLGPDSGIILKRTDKTHHKSRDFKKLAEVIRQKLETALQFDIRKKDKLASEFLGESGPLNAASEWTKKVIGAALTDGIQKADSIFLDICEYKVSSNIDNSFWEDISKTIIESYANSSSQYRVDIELTKTEKEKRKQQGFSYNEFFLEGETDRKLADIKNRYNIVEKELKNAGASAEQISKALDTLKNSFQISDTVKSYDKYNNNIGFHGGSIGSNVENQLTNILKMFEYGGISAPDKDWLLFAIYNSSNGTLGGHELKNKIEDLLSTVAAMLLFDDAGQQAIYITQQVQNRDYKPPTNFLHLYFLNGSYYPASFILSLTYDGLVKGQTILESQIKFNSNGSRANIINNTNDSQIIGGKRNPKTGRIITTSQEDWKKTFSGNKQNVKIEITFLAGLLDIMEKLNNAMANPF